MQWLKEFQENTNKWATERAIMRNSSAHVQLAKGITEAGEAVDAVLKNQKPELVDALGDTLVCLSIACGMWGEPVPYSKVNLEGGSKLQLAIELVGEVTSAAYHAYAYSEFPNLASKGLARTHIARAVDILLTMAPLIRHTVTLEYCANEAWDMIKDRKGTMSPEGVFVKEEN